MKISVKIVLYHFFLKAFVAYILANATRLQLTAQVEQLTNMWTNWLLTFDMYTDPAQNNEGVTSDMNGLYNANYIITEGIKNILRGNTLIVLKGADRLSLDIPMPTVRRNKVPPPEIKPNIALLAKTALTMKFFVYDPANPTNKPKPPGAGSVGTKVAIMKPGVIPAPTDYVNQIPEKGSMFENYYTLANVGMQLWMIAYYLSPTNEAGPDGEAFNTTII